MTPEQEEQVRRALAAAARADEPGPMPPEVVARLTGVVDELAAPRRTPAAVGAEADDEPDEIGARRGRRRHRPHGLVAAAAAAVIIAAGGTVAFQNLDEVGGSAESTSAGGSTAEDSGAADDSSGSGDSGADSGGGTAPEAAPSAEAPDDLDQGPGLTEPRLRTETLDGDVRQVATNLAGLDTAGRTELRSDRKVMVCDVPPTRRGDQVLVVRLDGKRATLVLAAPEDGTREARVYSCAAPGPAIARTVVDTP